MTTNLVELSALLVHRKLNGDYRVVAYEQLLNAARMTRIMPDLFPKIVEYKLVELTEVLHKIEISSNSCLKIKPTDYPTIFRAAIAYFNLLTDLFYKYQILSPQRMKDFHEQLAMRLYCVELEVVCDKKENLFTITKELFLAIRFSLKDREVLELQSLQTEYLKALRDFLILFEHEEGNAEQS